MKRWEEKTLFQQLAIILGLIGGLVAIYFLLVKIPALASTFPFLALLIVFPILWLWHFLWQCRKTLGESPEGVSTPASDKNIIDTEQKPARPIKEKLVIGVGVIFWLLLSVCLYPGFFVLGSVWAAGLTAMILTTILKSMRDKQQRMSESISQPKTLVGNVDQRLMKIREFTVVVFVVLMVFFLGCILSGMICSSLSLWEKPMVSSWIRFPIAEPKGVAVDRKGRIYSVATFYHRVQVFDSKGKFITGWFVALPKGSLHLDIVENDHLHIITSRDKNFLFDINGKLLGSPVGPEDYFEEFGKSSHYQTEDALGNKYKIRNPFLFPKIVKISPTGEESTVLSDPFYIWMMKAPLPAAVFMMCTLLIACALDQNNKKKRSKCVLADDISG